MTWLDPYETVHCRTPIPVQHFLHIIFTLYISVFFRSHILFSNWVDKFRSKSNIYILCVNDYIQYILACVNSVDVLPNTFPTLSCTAVSWGLSFGCSRGAGLDGSYCFGRFSPTRWAESSIRLLCSINAGLYRSSNSYGGQKSVGQYTDVQGYGLKDTLCCLVLLRKRRIFSAFSFISARRAWSVTCRLFLKASLRSCSNEAWLATLVYCWEITDGNVRNGVTNG